MAAQHITDTFNEIKINASSSSSSSSSSPPYNVIIGSNSKDNNDDLIPKATSFLVWINMVQGLDMIGQFLHLVELHSTRLAFEVGWSAVQVEVSLKVRRRCAAFVTRRTVIWIFPLMLATVSCQRPLISKQKAAQRALVFLSRVPITDLHLRIYRSQHFTENHATGYVATTRLQTKLYLWSNKMESSEIN